jgi:CHAT domain-containing protein/tetratricopeptide (TPR) repeat protein
MPTYKRAFARLVIVLLTAFSSAMIGAALRAGPQKPSPSGAEIRQEEKVNAPVEKKKDEAGPDQGVIVYDLVTDGATVTALCHPTAAAKGGGGAVAEDFSFKLEDLAGACELAEGVLEERRKHFGDKHYRVADARLMLAQLRQMQKLAPDQAKLLAQAAPLHGQSRGALAKGNPQAALPLSEPALEIRTQVLGWEVPLSMVTLNDLAYCHKAIRSYAKAESLYERSLAIHEKVAGAQHPDLAFVLSSFGEMYYDQGEYAKTEPLWQKALDIRKALRADKPADYADSLNEVASLRRTQARYREAAPLYQQALAIRKELVGEQHPDYANCLTNLATIYEHLGEFTKAEPLEDQAMGIFKSVFGDKDPRYAGALSARAIRYSDLGQYAKAEQDLERALAIRKEVLGTKHPDYVASLNNLSTLYRQGDLYEKAEAVSREALVAAKVVVGEKHYFYAISLYNLASLYDLKGQYASAEPLLEQAVALCKEVSGEKSKDYVVGLSQLAAHYLRKSDYVKALALLGQAATIGKETLGDSHPYYISTLETLAKSYTEIGNYTHAVVLQRQIVEARRKSSGETSSAFAHSLRELASSYAGLEEYGRAAPMLRRALEIQKELFGENNLAYAATLYALGSLHYDMLEFAQAEPLLLKSAAIRKNIEGVEHPEYATNLDALGTLYLALADYAKAYAYSREALRITRSHVQQTADAQSEQQQLSFSRYCQLKLNRYLTIGLAARADAEEEYGEVLAWKGMVWARQLRMRRLRGAASDVHPETIRLAIQLATAGQRLANLTVSQLGSTPSPQRGEELAALSGEIERLEKDLSRASAPFRRQLELRDVTAQKLRACLPTGSVLVDFLEYWHHAPRDATGPGGDEPCLTAFVIKPDRAAARVELGPMAPISKLVARWRESFGAERTGAEVNPATELRRLVWQPLEPYLNDAKMVLVSPDESLGRLAFSALPGREPGQFLIEERAIAVVAVPQLLPELMEQERLDNREPSLLVVGDVDFDRIGSKSRLAQAKPAAAADNGSTVLGEARSVARAAPRGLPGAPARKFDPLPATGTEISAIKRSFQRRFPAARVTELRGSEAHTEALRGQAVRHQYLHLATHGFFAPEGVPSALEANAGAPQPSGMGRIGSSPIAGFHPGLLSGIALAGANRPEDADDGILTALEVADLDLAGVNLVVLSACGTSLGEAARAEGLQGLQRAFQVAGARSVIASLWDVPDRATQLLMERFYDNLWQKKQSKFDALREAQLWVMKEMPKNPETFRGGLVRADKTTDERSRYVRYWAAFVLSGDWR